MASLKSILIALAAAAFLPAFTCAAPTPVPQDGVIGDLSAANDADLSIRAAPQWYQGPWRNFPGKSTWLSWDELWKRNDDNIVLAGSTWDDAGRLNIAIQASSKEFSIDPRVLLVMMMQESSGYVSVRTTFSFEGLATAGVMQCMNCPGYPGRKNLSQAEINGMVRGGAKHFRADLDKVGGNGWEPSSVYPALRLYNSGSINNDNLSDGKGATPAYVSEVVQRLGGWIY
ncbi:hypothetical protein MN608_00694 [Microdochium nivale]|nr:hypothetical protein MN608_00694 [Microdochium nivale]